MMRELLCLRLKSSDVQTLRLEAAKAKMSVTRFLEVMVLDWRRSEVHDKIIAFALGEACLFGAQIVEAPDLDLTRLATEHPRLALNLFRNAYRNVDGIVDRLPLILSSAEGMMKIIELDRQKGADEGMKRIA